MTKENGKFIDALKFNDKGLITAVVQDIESNEVLMVAYMNHEALRRTITSGNATYWSRSRQKYWVKGETSGNIQKVEAVLVDCDTDSILLKVRQTGPACHEGYQSCFFRRITNNGDSTEIIADRLKTPQEIYGS